MNIIQLHNFINKIELDLLMGCWLWRGSKHPDGYGMFNIIDKPMLAHRISYEYWMGKIPDGLQIDHLCRNRSCCNPNHLEVITPKENINRGLPVKITWSLAEQAVSSVTTVTSEVNFFRSLDR